MTIIVELMNSCRKEPKICMQCRVTNDAMLALHSTTKAECVVEILGVEEEDQLAEAKDQSLAINVTNKDTMQGIVIRLSQHVLIVNLMNTLWKTIQRY